MQNVKQRRSRQHSHVRVDSASQDLGRSVAAKASVGILLFEVAFESNLDIWT